MCLGQTRRGDGEEEWDDDNETEPGWRIKRGPGDKAGRVTIKRPRREKAKAAKDTSAPTLPLAKQDRASMLLRESVTPAPSCRSSTNQNR